MSTPRIRPAEARDLPGLVRIYNHYVTQTHVTFDTDALTAPQRRSWFETFADSGAHQLLVAESVQRLAGYASSTRLRPKTAYDRSVETTIYIDPGFTGRGIGELLYGALLDRMRSEDSVHRAYAAIALPNPSSVALHERLGFALVGTFSEVGFKFGRYFDIAWSEKDVSSGPQ